MALLEVPAEMPLGRDKVTENPACCAKAGLPATLTVT